MLTNKQTDKYSDKISEVFATEVITYLSYRESLFHHKLIIEQQT